MLYSPTRLREVLRVQGRTVNWLAEVTGYAPSTISRILNGSQPMTDPFARVAAKHLGIPTEWLCDESASPREVVPA